MAAVFGLQPLTYTCHVGTDPHLSCCLQLTIAPLLSWLRQNALTEREDLFIKGNSV